MKNLLLLIFAFAIGFCNAQTVGLTLHTAASLDDGYVLFAPIGSNTTYLIDKCGREIHTWHSDYKPGQMVALLPDGTLLHTGVSVNNNFIGGGKGGVIEKIDWNGNVTWRYLVSDATHCQHHDARALPNGNVLVIAWEARSNTEAIAAGRNPALVPAILWSEQVLELQPVGTSGATVVWEWHLWDHLVQDYDHTKANFDTVARHPELVNLNYNASATNSDWIHFNAIDYNADLDQVLISSHAFSEMWVIDHSTTTAQAASHSGGQSGKGGDILYRWGNPQAYGNGTAADRKWFGQHHPHWIDAGLPNAGKVMVFNNGLNRPGGSYSTAEIIDLPVSGSTYNSALPYLPATQEWIYNAGNPFSYYAQNISGAQQLPNGNVLLCNGPGGIFTEIDTAGNTLWNYIDPVAATGVLQQDSAPSQNMAFRCTYYPATFSGFSGHSLTPGGPIENTNPLSASCTLNTGVAEYAETNLRVWPNPASNVWTVALPEAHSKVVVRDATGREMLRLQAADRNAKIFAAAWPSGLYFLEVQQVGTTWRTVLVKE